MPQLNTAKNQNSDLTQTDEVAEILALIRTFHTDGECDCNTTPLTLDDIEIMPSQPGEWKSYLAQASNGDDWSL